MEARGRITPCGTGLWEDEQRDAFGESHPVPQETDEKAITATVALLAPAARRASEAEFDVIELPGVIGLIYTADMAEQAIGNGQADIIIMARALLNDPNWPVHAAKALKAKIPWSVQYERGDIF